MTSGQRKVHKFAWIMIAIAIPVLVFFSIRNLDFSGTKETKQIVVQASKENVLKVAENELIKANLFENSIEVIVKTPLKTPSSIVYSINKNGKKRTFLGQVATVGIYNFNLDTAAQGIVIFDAIKEVEITKLLF
ncbi:MAG: hypothetical protein JKY02_10845 [Flavobacteriaceae bacterium]|nr:hypothetical protein [Flavobacteriaceae bacterium]